MTDSGLRIPRRYTTEGADPYSTIEWARRDSRITNPDGSVVFEVLDAEVPASWSQVATDIVVSKYFRKAGVPQIDADGNPVLDDDGNPVLGSETSGRQVFDRLATHLALVGREARLLRLAGRRPGLRGRDEVHARQSDRLAQLAAVVQHRPRPCLWHHRHSPRAFGTSTPRPAR